MNWKEMNSLSPGYNSRYYWRVVYCDRKAHQLRSFKLSMETEVKNAKETQGEHKCNGCKEAIHDRYLLKALDLYWHEDCLTCDCCQCRLADISSSLYIRANLMLCKRDYLRLFGKQGVCSVCSKTIAAFELVMRAGENAYHIECFACQRCKQRFRVGEEFLFYNNTILCEEHYRVEKMREEHEKSSPDVDVNNDNN